MPTEAQRKKSAKIINDLIEKHESMRDFGRKISEDPADIMRWKSGKSAVRVRAVITICRLFGYEPHEVNPDLFPQDLSFVFKK
jgi:hypothetical protein